MRVAFSIILNALHHLQHNNYFDSIVNNFDLWVFVDGLALPGGSTSWCKKVDDRWHKNFHSRDGTIEFIKERNYPNVALCSDHLGAWSSKDAMVNTSIDVIRSNECCRMWLESGEPTFLWQCDVDEQWTKEQLCEAEKELVSLNAGAGCFRADYYIGNNLLAKGEWGEGYSLTKPLRFATIRLWNWKGQKFAYHEPPVLDGGNGNLALLSQRFKHYAYYFERDVAFKNEYYSGHEGILDNWKSLQEETVFPQPISRLISGHYGKTATQIVKI